MQRNRTNPRAFVLQTLPRTRLAVVLGWSVLAGSVALGQVITVTTWEDRTDFAGSQMIADLPGPDGRISLREATTAANNTPGAQSIHFAIPRSTWWTLFPNQCGIEISNAIFLTDAGTTIDFTTQTALTGDTYPGGWEIAIFYSGTTTFVSQFMVLADSCTLKGMDYVGGNSTGPSVRLYGNRNRIIAATSGRASVAIDPSVPTPDAGNVIGGLTPEERNDMLYVWFVHGASGNRVIGNTIRRVQITGDTLYGPCNNNRIGGPTAEERNTISGNARTGEEGYPTGIQVEVAHAVGTIIEGNYIGTTTDGMLPWPASNGTAGVSVGIGASGTIIRNNLISGIARTGTFHYAGQRFGTGIVVTDGSSNTTIVGNRIGGNASGSGTITNVQGLLVARSTTLAAAVSGVRIGGLLPGEGNIIAGSEQAGVVIHSTVAGVRVSGNSISGNGGLGIDLMGSLGVTPNDLGDGDVGGNLLQNHPVIASATADGTATRVVATLNSLPNQRYWIEFFASATCGASGTGQGAAFLGGVEASTNGSGIASIDTVLPFDLPIGSVVTATATRVLSNDTSEFSACATVIAGACDPIDFNQNSLFPEDQDLIDFLSVLAGGPCSPGNTCSDIDFNNDGLFPSDDDLIAFLRVLAGGAC